MIVVLSSDDRDQTLTCHSGVIELIDYEKVTVPYLQANSNDRCHWVYQEKAATLCAPVDKIIVTALSVKNHTPTICCPVCRVRVEEVWFFYSVVLFKTAISCII